MNKRSRGGSIVLKGDAAHAFFAAAIADKKPFTAVDGEKCDRCGGTWHNSVNTPGAVHHLCQVQGRSPNEAEGHE